MAGSRRRLTAAGIGFALLAATPLAAQRPLTVAGRVVRLVRGDTVPVPGVPLTLHHVGRTAQGAIDSGATGKDGRFRFRVPGDTGALYLVSARFAGIEYFGDPLRVPGSDQALVLVSDTSSTAPLLLGSRHVIVRRPDSSGARAVLDLLSIRNDGPDTRVGRDSASPTWWLPLPVGAMNAEVREGEVSAAAIQFREDTLFLYAPVAPGRKSVMVSYLLPAPVNRPRWIAPVDTFDLLVEEDGATVRGAGLLPADSVTMMETTLRRWSATPPAGEWGEVRFTGGGPGRGAILAGLIALVAVALGAGAAVAFRKPGGGRDAPVPVAPPPDLIGELARLDARYLGNRESVGEREWAAYVAERARLKAAAEAAALARRVPRA